MKMLNNFKCSILVSISITMGLVTGCNDNKLSTTSISNNSGGIHTAELRSMQQELEHVGKIAQSLTQNYLGYWEADFGNGIVMIYVPEGSFTIGNNALSPEVVTGSQPATPAHQVTLSHYWISKTPVTIGQFRAFVKSNNYVTQVEKAGHSGPFVYDFASNGFMPKQGYYWDNAFKDVTAKYPEITVNDNHPVSCVSWNDAIAYTNWLKSSNGLKFTLPTEAEWEYAARGTDGRIYPWGNETPDGTRANYADETFNLYFPNTGQSIVHQGVNDGFAITSPVGTFPLGHSPVGALDMAGNLTEWVYDSAYEYTETPKTNPVYIASNGTKMQKAGFWAGSAGRPNVTPNELMDGHNIRSDARQGDDPNSADDHLGFRIAISYTQRDSVSNTRQFGIFKVLADNTTVEMNGSINSATLNNFNNLIRQYPNINKINMNQVPGSVDDEVNLQVSKRVYDLGIATHLMDNGEIASGGVDFFIAGVQRSKGENTRIGVHSWGGDNGESASNYPEGHANHQPYIDYYVSVGFTPQLAKDFYYFTINAAPAESIHWMTEAEIGQYGLITE